ncbi:MAG: TonB-dependent receptor, partial [Pseudomonadota bacterium]
NSEPNEKCNGLNNRSRTGQHDGGLSVQATFTSAIGARDNALTIGVAQVRSSATFTQSSQFGYLTPDRGVATVSGPGAFADGSQDSENAFDARVDLTSDTETRSVFFTDSLQLSPIAVLTLSGRYDHTSVDNVDALTPAGEPGSLSGSHRFSRFNPAAGFTLTLLPAVKAYVSYSEGSRAPSAIELGCADPENPCRLPNAMAGDPPLEQVRTRTFEGGLRGTWGKAVAWNAGLFRADNRDDILFVADDQSGFGYFKNFGKTRRQGAELGLKGRLGTVELGANLTLLEATYRSEEEVGGEGNSSNAEGFGFEGTIDIEPGDRIPLIPRHIFKASASWDILPQLSVSADLVNIGAAYARGNENNEHEPDGVFYIGEGETGSYTVVNLGAEFRPVPALTIFAQLNNAFDREYYTGAQLGSTGFDGAGRFVARPFAGPVVDGERPLLGSTFYAPGAPRSYWLGVRYSFF